MFKKIDGTIFSILTVLILFICFSLLLFSGLNFFFGNLLNMDNIKLKESLVSKEIVIPSENSKLLEIAKINSKDVYQLFILILLLHLELQ